MNRYQPLRKKRYQPLKKKDFNTCNNIDLKNGELKLNTGANLKRRLVNQGRLLFKREDLFQKILKFGIHINIYLGLGMAVCTASTLFKNCPGGPQCLHLVHW